MGGGSAPCGSVGGVPWVSSALTNFFRPGGLNPAIANALIGTPAKGCINAALAVMQQGGLVRRAIRQPTGSLAAFLLAIWTPTTPMEVRSIMASPLISKSGLEITTNFWRHTPGRTQLMIRRICNRRLLRKIAISPATSGRLRYSTSVTAWFSVACIKPESFPERVSPAASSAIGPSLQSWKLLRAGHSTSSPVIRTTFSSRLAQPPEHRSARNACDALRTNSGFKILFHRIFSGTLLHPVRCWRHTDSTRPRWKSAT